MSMTVTKHFNQSLRDFNNKGVNMLGLKINEFDNSDGTIKSFNKIFPMTQLRGDGDVEILNIVDRGQFSNNLYMRNIEVNGKNIEHDFGENNFYDNKDFALADNIRFKYYAKDLEGKTIAVGYNQGEIAEQLNCGIGVIKRKMFKDIDKSSKTQYLFNVTRVEL